MLIAVLRNLFGRGSGRCPAEASGAPGPPGRAHLDAGLAAHAAGNHSEAETAYRRALAAEPSNHETLHLLGVVLKLQGRGAEAIRHFERAVQLGSEDAELRHHLAGALHAVGALDRAAQCYAEALAREPRLAAAHSGLAALHRERGELGRAIACLRRTVELEPAVAEGWHNLAAVLFEAGQAREAEAAFDRALALDPGLAEARFSHALALLLQGDLARGWEAYECRLDVPRLAPNSRRFDAPVWRGEPVEGRTLLVHGEQGVGDELLFASMLPDLLARGCRCVLECRDKLADLFGRSFPEVCVVARRDPPDLRCLQGIDVQAAVGSLARYLRPGLASFAGQRAYLCPDPQRMRYWRERLESLGPGLRVGFSWRSTNATGIRALTCTKLEQWAGLFAVPGVHWICLQYDECEAELQEARRRFGVALHRFAEVDHFDDLDEVAALTAALDLVITAPTTVSRQSAALGVETWELSFGADWQTLGTQCSPWLPAMRRYERSERETWAELFDRVAEELRARTPGASAGTGRQVDSAVAAATSTSTDELDRACAAFAAGRHAECRRVLLPLVQAGSADADVWQLMGMACQGDGALREALDAFLGAGERRPDLGAAWIGAGGAALALGDHATAIRAYRCALAAGVDLPGVHLNLGRALEAAGQTQQAIDRLCDALARDPQLAEAHLNLGALLRGEGRLDEAQSHLERAIALRPDSSKAYFNLGRVFEEKGLASQSEAAYRAAVAVDPANFEARLNLGGVLFAHGRDDEALPELEGALTILGGPDAETALLREIAQARTGIPPLSPQVAQAGWNLALARFAQGDLKRGWLLHECRLHESVSKFPWRRHPQRRWGGEPPGGTTLLVHGEQGVGDELLFASLVPDLLATGAHVVLECRAKLAALFARSFPEAIVVPQADPPDARCTDGIDFQIPVGSLGRYLRPGLESFPSRRSYLTAAPARVAHWRSRLDRIGTGLKIGFCWRSTKMKARSSPKWTRIDQWSALFAVQGVHWVSLQYDDCEPELAAARARFGVGLHRFPEIDYFDDLDEAGALTQALDLVISVPTAVSVQSAAQGVATWQLGYGTDWKLFGTSTMPWLPCIVRYERPMHERWESVLAKVASDLERAMRERTIR